MAKIKKGYFDDKVIFISGGTGSWGNELVTQLLKFNDPKEIRIYSRGELKQVEMKRRFYGEDKLTFFIGDVRDKERLMTVMRGTDYAFHLAALKHVPVCEENSWEAVQTNIVGTQNIISTAIEAGVKKVIDISTDKAVDPYNLYGTTKAVGEKLIISANLLKTKTRFVCIRGGNVLGTNGSVVPLFREQILRGGTLTITDEKMTRYMMNLNEAISLIFEATVSSVGGEIFVMKMPALKVGDLADLMIKELSLTRKNLHVKKEIIGIRPGEKLHEVLVSRYESTNALEQGDYYVILPNIHLPEVQKKYKGMKSVDFKEFNSNNTHLLTYDEIKTMLEKESWLDKDINANFSNIQDKDLQNPFEQEGWKRD
ncbi:polysaccharide biosynthesis protein [Candidatus Woesearchaeota archaeon]|nr:polysaccharide biosynthesis protein [Candidatus Woesearchaeota archaeon]